MIVLLKNSKSIIFKNYLLQVIAVSLFTLFLILPNSGFAQTKIKQPAPPQISDFSSTLGFLSSGWMEGREAGTRGALMAADYIASMMQLFQLMPYQNIKDISHHDKTAKNYFQNFEIVNYKTESSTIALIQKSTNSVISYPFSAGIDFELEAGPNSIDAETPVVFAGYGINAVEIAYNDYKNIDIKGKAVMVIDGFPGHLDSKSNAWKRFSKAFNDEEEILDLKIETARKLGAIALIIVDASAKYQHKNQINNQLFALSKDSNQLADPIYEESVCILPDDIINSNMPIYKVSSNVGRQILAGTGIDLATFEKNAAASNIASSLPINGKVLKILVNVKKEALLVRNILGMIPGIDSSKYLILGAHYDHLGSRNGLIYNGADDNASGVAGLLALAKTWSQSNIKPACNIIFASWTAEEEGLLGSRYFVQNLNIDPKNILLYINMDMISRSELEDSLKSKLSIGTRTIDKEIRSLAEKSNNTLNRPFKLDLWDVTGHSGSDYASFTERNIPIMTFNTGLHNDYHTPRDISSNVDSEKMENVLTLINAYLEHFTSNLNK